MYENAQALSIIVTMLHILPPLLFINAMKLLRTWQFTSLISKLLCNFILIIESKHCTPTYELLNESHLYILCYVVAYSSASSLQWYDSQEDRRRG
jgi:hypothetical protein